ncbi:hypothetical protein JK364_49580 [Streptomyces sp. 110]|uniref:Uncharacterized protein n=1 Tax=Streptomyces endocoffeicus TaxID=2898945 RepID=A0ABS1Q6I5_9ACTN|nr:hypothetical protein [Streptomyces endocoffeicus]MBL1120291.1 hypothetical protein [Streptomyces endocoffeicus]
MLLHTLGALARRIPVRVYRAFARRPSLPPIARIQLPDATGVESETYNRTRVATAVALYLYRVGYREDVPESAITLAVQALGWTKASGQTRAAVRAVLGVLTADPGIARGR